MSIVFQLPLKVGLAVGSALAPTSLGFSAKLLHLNTEGANTVVKKEE